MKKNKLHTCIKIALAVSLGSASSMLSQMAIAQEAAEEEVEKIAILGTRGAPRTVTDSPVAVDVFSGK